MAKFAAWWGRGDRKRRREAEEIPEPVGVIWRNETLRKEEDIVPYFMDMQPYELFKCGVDEYEDQRIFRVVLTIGRRYDVTVTCEVGSSKLETGGRLYTAERIESVTYKEIMDADESEKSNSNTCTHPKKERSYIGNNLLRCDLCGAEFS